MTATNGTGGRVLVVDVDRDVRRIISRHLRSAGFATQGASNGRKALESARSYRPSVVLLEINLPELSGYEVCHQLRREFGREMTIFFVSGERTEGYDRDAARLLGADDCIAKPFDVDELIAKIRHAVGARDDQAVEVNLTERERDVLKLLSEGLGEKLIAERLFISRKTVATHIQHILPKLGVHSRAEAVAFVHCKRLFDRS